MARQAEQDPTNLYIANLPHSVKESDLETMFSPYGQVFIIVLLKKVEDKDDKIIIVIPTITITTPQNHGQVVSTRILRDTNQQSRGVGFARMESRDKCEQIIRCCAVINTNKVEENEI